MTADSVEWDTVQPMSMPTLLDRVVLHDSILDRLSIDSDSRLTVDIDIDTVHNRSLPEGFDTLMLRFEHPYRVRWIRGAVHHLGLCVMAAESVVLDSGARGALLDDAEFNSYFFNSEVGVVHPAEDATLTRTRFELLDQATLEILHGASVRAVMVNSDSWTFDVSTIAGNSI